MNTKDDPSGGSCTTPNPAALDPTPFAKHLDDRDYEESWSDGLVMLHNPYALRPANPEVFADISHIYYSDQDGFDGYHQPYDVLGSVTMVISSAAEDAPEGLSPASPTS